MYSKQDTPSRIFPITHCLPGEHTQTATRKLLGNISYAKTILEETIAVGLAPTDGKHHGKNNNQKK